MGQVGPAQPIKAVAHRPGRPNPKNGRAGPKFEKGRPGPAPAHLRIRVEHRMGWVQDGLSLEWTRPGQTKENEKNI